MSKTMRSQKSKKKTIRTILIAAAVAVVIALIILLVFALDKDEAGMNCFQRKATVASAYGEKVSMAEYLVAYNQYYVYVQYACWTPETIAQTLLLE